MIKRKHNAHGFTLLEMIVALAIFSVVAVIAVGALVRVVGLNRRAQTLQSAMIDLSFALESMSREIRVGSTYYCLTGMTNGYINPNTWTYTGGSSGLSSSPCPMVSGANGPSQSAVVIFLNGKVDSSGCPLLTAYLFMPPGSSGSADVYRAEQNSCNDTIGGSPGGSTANFTSILTNDPNIKLSDYRFGVTAGSNGYDFVYIRFTGTSGVRAQDVNTFDIETAISKRVSG